MPQLPTNLKDPEGLVDLIEIETHNRENAELSSSQGHGLKSESAIYDSFLDAEASIIMAGEGMLFTTLSVPLKQGEPRKKGKFHSKV